MHQGPQKVWQCLLDTYLSHTSSESGIGNLLRIAILMKFPIPLFFWQNLKFRENGSCRKTSVWCWPAPGRRVANKKTKPVWLHVFTPLKRFRFGSNQEKEHLRFLFCASSFKYHSPESWNFVHQEETNHQPSLTTCLSLNPTLTNHSSFPTCFTPVAFTLSILGSLHQPSHLQIYKVSKCSWLRTFSSTGLILGC